MLEVLQRCFPTEVKNGWSAKLTEMIPSFGQSLIENAELCRKVRAETAEVLNLQNVSGS
jgi:malate dehydrogenase (quinone)